jgi:hypothetical protein
MSDSRFNRRRSRSRLRSLFTLFTHNIEDDCGKRQCLDCCYQFSRFPGKRDIGELLLE